MRQTKSRYIPALDGLRALAVLAVIAYHMSMPWARGGLLGVTVFFVLSGYLITSLLLIEYQNTGKIDLPQFWLRRIRRLVPAIVFVIACSAVLFTLLDHVLLTKMRDDVVPSLLFFNNWWQIFHDVSYFEALGAPSPLTHFWSLAIEEQFYLIWPVVLFICLKLGVKKGTMSKATLGIAVLSAIEMALLFDPAGDPSRVYYGTDTRAFSLLIGAWLAFVWPSHMLGSRSAHRISKSTRMALDAVGAAALIALVAMLAVADGFSPFLYRGGILLASVLTAVLIAVIVHPASIIGRIAGTAVPVWIGKRSYGIYLWHFPLLLLMNPRNFTGETAWWMYLLQLAVIFACAAFSYRFVENPIRHGAIGEFLREVTVERPPREYIMRHGVVPAACAGVLILAAVGGLVLTPPESAVKDGAAMQQEGAQTSQNLTNLGSEEDLPKLDVLLIGDSVSVRTIPQFEEKYPYGAIDSAVSRPLSDGVGVYNYYNDAGIVGDVVVFALGTNGPASDEQIDALVNAVGPDKHIFFINTRSPLDWVDTTNNAIAGAASRFDNVSVIDWFSASAGHDEYFDGDGTHLNVEGSEAYLNLIDASIGSLLPVHEEGDEVATLNSRTQKAYDRLKALIPDPSQGIAHAVLTNEKK